jgi:hypothetical protein
VNYSLRSRITNSIFELMNEHIPFVETYKNAKYTNPGDAIDPKKKQDPEDKIAQDWFRRKCEYMYSCYIRDDAYIPYSTVRDYRICRLYGQGRQPNTKYMERLTIQDKRTGIRKGWMNMSWDILPILTKFRNVVLGKFEEIDYSTQAHAIDDVSNTIKEDKKLGYYVEQKYKDWLAPIREAIEVETPEMPKLPFVPKNMEELDVLGNMGFFRLAYEITMDKLLIATAQKSNWQEIKRRLFEDAVDLGIIAVKDYNDPVNGKPMTRYVDPEYLIIRQTRMNDFSNVSEAAEITWMSIGDLRAYGLKDEELSKAAKAYSGIFGNPYMTDIPGYPQDRNRYDYLKVAVLDTEFESFDTYFFESRMINERPVYFNLPFGAQKPTSKRNKLGQRQYQKRYRCKWVIGTDIIFDHGLQYDQHYDQENKPRSSYSCYRIAEKSMISQCITSADDIQLAVLKLRNAMAESKPAGIMVEFGSLKEIAMGGEKMDPFDILKIYRDRGDLIFKYALQQNGMPLQGGIPPITELRGGIGPYLQELMAVLEWNINMIREITGINQAVDASTPAAGSLVGTAQIAEQGTNNVLRPMLMGYKSIKQRCYMNICQRWQLAGQFYPQTLPFAQADGSGTIEILKIGKELYSPVFDVFIDMPVKQEDKMQLEQACLASLQAAKAGAVGITLSDYMYIKELIAINNMRMAWLYLSYREKEIQEQKDATSAQMQAMNAQMQQEAEMMKQQMAAQRETALEAIKFDAMTMEYYYKMQLEVVKKTGQIPNDIAASAQQLMAQMAQAEQAEQEAAMQEQMMQEQMMQQQGGMEQPTAPV